jgi:hypothetical protein
MIGAQFDSLMLKLEVCQDSFKMGRANTWDFVIKGVNINKDQQVKIYFVEMNKKVFVFMLKTRRGEGLQCRWDLHQQKVSYFFQNLSSDKYKTGLLFLKKETRGAYPPPEVERCETTGERSEPAIMRAHMVW